MVETVIVVGVHPILNTITSPRTHAAEAVKRRTFNYFACPVIEVSRTVAPAKFTVEQSEPIAVMVARQNNQQLRQGNAPELLKKERGVKTKQRIPVDVVTYINIYNTFCMKKTLLFAIDLTTNEVIVSESQKGRMEITFIERIHQSENELLFDSVSSMTKLTTSLKFDIALFKAMDKVCQLIYAKQSESESGE
jgi:hypothetical protein